MDGITTLEAAGGAVELGFDVVGEDVELDWVGVGVGVVEDAEALGDDEVVVGVGVGVVDDAEELGDDEVVVGVGVGVITVGKEHVLVV